MQKLGRIHTWAILSEVKNARIGEGTKVSHLTYVGDADVGKSVNFGCGCVTVNYTGKEKHRTVIGDHAFIGCNSNLVAPSGLAIMDIRPRAPPSPTMCPRTH